MKITYIKTSGFRKFEKEFETNLYDITEIIGGNAKGKTNVLYAIIWAFLGTNLTGDDKICLCNKNSNMCYVELKFIDNNNKEHTLVRQKHKTDNSMNFLLLDNKRCKQEELQAYYSDKKLFLTVLNPSYFINKKPAEQKEFIDSYLPKVDMETVYNRLSNSEKQYLEEVPTNIIDYTKELNENEKIYKNKIQVLLGKIEYAENIIKDMVIEKKKVFYKMKELSLARQELSYLTTDNTQVQAKQQKIVENIEKQVIELKQKITELNNIMMLDKNIYLSLKEEKESYCPLCEQKIENESKITTIKNMKAELEEKFNNRERMKNDLSDLETKLAIEKCKLYSLNGNKNVNTENRISEVKEQISKLENEQTQIEKYNANIELKESKVEEAKQDIEMFKNEMQKYNELISNIKKSRDVLKKMYINYIEEKMKFATPYLTNVAIKYYSILKETGEIKEDFIITYRGNEIKNLSKSENIATSLELSNMFNKIANTNIPLFIDDSESCADYDFIQRYGNNNQILIARVEKGQNLQILDGNVIENENVA